MELMDYKVRLILGYMAYDGVAGRGNYKKRPTYRPTNVTTQMG